MIRSLGADAMENVFEADIVVIGSGAMGLAVASGLLNTNISVLLVEAGGINPSKESDELYEAEVVGHPFNGITAGRRRVFGEPPPAGAVNFSLYATLCSRKELGWVFQVGH